MDRETAEKYHGDAAWRAAYLTAFARAEAVGHEAAGTFAAIAADIDQAEASAPAAVQERRLAETRARIAAYEAERAKAEATPDPTEASQAAMARVVARLNANRVGTQPQGQQPAQAAPQGQVEGHAEEPEQDPAQAAMAKAVAKINASR